MKRISLILLRIAMLGITLGVLALCTVLISMLWGSVTTEYPKHAYVIYTIFTIILITALPFYVGMYHAWRLLSSINHGLIFTRKSFLRLRAIAVASAIISVLYLVSLPFFYTWADNTDAPGLMIIGLTLVGGPLIVSVFGYLLYEVIREAADLKSESELTV